MPERAPKLRRRSCFALICCSSVGLEILLRGVQVMSHKVSVPQQRAGRDTQEGAEEARVYLHRAMMKSYSRSERGEGMGGALPVLSHKAGI